MAGKIKCMAAAGVPLLVCWCAATCVGHHDRGQAMIVQAGRPFCHKTNDQLRAEMRREQPDIDALDEIIRQFDFITQDAESAMGWLGH